MKPRCYDCLTEDVSVKVIDTMGFEHWFCAEDWAGWVEFGEKLHRRLADAVHSSGAVVDDAQPGDGGGEGRDRAGGG